MTVARGDRVCDARTAARRGLVEDVIYHDQGYGAAFNRRIQPEVIVRWDDSGETETVAADDVRAETTINDPT